MSALRVIGDWLLGRTDLASGRPFDDQPAVGCPDWHDRAILMRREGLDCRNPDHADALRRLGQMTIERDTWKARAVAAEAKLRHPSTGTAEAA